MRRFSPPVKHDPLNASKARLAVVMNQCATPGLGSLMARRYIAGTGQLLLSLGGAALILVWFANILKVAYSIMESTGEPDLKPAVGWLGFGLLFLAWCWAWISSIGILREIRRGQKDRWEAMPGSAAGDAVPPRLKSK